MSDLPPSFPFVVTPQVADPPTGYVWGRYHRSYLRYLVGKCRTSPREVAAKMGLSFLKFQRLRRNWESADGDMPLKYFEALGPDKDLLETCLEMDRREYRDVLSIPRCADGFTVKLMPCVYRRVRLPEGTPEDIAVEVMLEHAIMTGCPCWLIQGPLISFYTNAIGGLITQTYEPRMGIEDGHVIFDAPDLTAGVMRLG